MLSLKNILLLTLSGIAAASPLANKHPRDAGTDLLLADLVNLDNSVMELTRQVDAYEGGIPEATPILLAITAVHTANRKGFYDVQTIEKQNFGESTKIVKYVSDPVAVDIRRSVKATEKKKKLFDETGLTQTVLDSLKLLKDDHDTFSAEVAKKLDPLTLPAALVPVAAIDAVLTEGIAVYST